MEDAEIKVQFTCEISIDEEGSSDYLQSLMEEMMEWERNGQKVLQPAIVYSDCPYANEVEFGTGPGNKSNESTQARMIKMERWVEKRLHENDGERKHRLALAMMNKIDKEGIAPSPYFRSSLDLVLRDRCPKGNDNATDYLENGGSLLDLAKEIKERVQSTLEMNQMEITHTLIDSFKAEPISSYSISNGEVLVSDEPSDESVTEDMWQDKSLGRNGKRPTRYWRYPS